MKQLLPYVQHGGLCHLEALNGAPLEALKGQGDLCDGRCRSARCDQKLRSRVGSDPRLVEPVPDTGAQLLEMAPLDRVGLYKRLGQDDGTEVERVDMLDMVAECEDQFSAAAADVGNGAGAVTEIKAQRDAVEGEPGLFFARNNPKPEPGFTPHAAYERRSVERIPDGARGDG